MKHAKIYVYVIGLALFGMMALGAVPAWASVVGTGSGPIISWDQTINCTPRIVCGGFPYKCSHVLFCPRFVVLTNMSSQAVLDSETGLVWEQSPDTSNYGWEDAQMHCNNLTTGGRGGWRMPTLQELTSLIDPSQSNPALPQGNPFNNVQVWGYWSATTYDADNTQAWAMSTLNGAVIPDPKPSSGYLSGGAPLVWCVRGGQGANPQ